MLFSDQYKVDCCLSTQKHYPVLGPLEHNTDLVMAYLNIKWLNDMVFGEKLALSVRKPLGS